MLSGFPHRCPLLGALRAPHTRLPEAWREASTLSDFGLRLTPRRTDELIAALFDLVRSWEDSPQDESDTADVALVIHAFPRPGSLTIEGEHR